MVTSNQPHLETSRPDSRLWRERGRHLNPQIGNGPHLNKKTKWKLIVQCNPLKHQERSTNLRPRWPMTVLLARGQGDSCWDGVFRGVAMLVLTGAPISNSRKRRKRDAFKSTILQKDRQKYSKICKNALPSHHSHAFPIFLFLHSSFTTGSRKSFLQHLW